MTDTRTRTRLELLSEASRILHVTPGELNATDVYLDNDVAYIARDTRPALIDFVNTAVFWITGHLDAITPPLRGEQLEAFWLRFCEIFGA
jgi:hypothetical protein